MKALKRICTLLLSVSMVICTTACSSAGSSNKDASSTTPVEGNSSVNEDSSSTSALKPVGEFPFANGEKITLGLTKNSLVEDYDTNLLTKRLEKYTGLDIEFVLFPEMDAQQKLEVMVTSGAKLPDILSFGLTDVAVMNYSKAGKIIPLDDYYAKYAHHINESVDIIKKDHGYDVVKYITSPDGHIYATPGVFISMNDTWTGKAWINQDWLNKLNKEMPKTLDELTDVLTAFKDGDPNGNGKKDEIPMLGAGKGFYMNAQEYLMNSFTYVNDLYLQAENGKISVPYNKEEWKQGLQYIKKMVDNNLLSPLSFTQDNKQLKVITDKTSREESLAGVVVAGGFPPIVSGTNEYGKESYVSLLVLTGPNGIGYTRKSPPIIDYGMSITSDCENPEAAFRFMDCFSSKEISTWSRWGIEGKDWERPGENDKSGYEALGIAPDVKSLNPDIWTATQNVHWGASALGIGVAIANVVLVEGDLQSKNISAIAMNANKVPKETVEKINYTPEELNEIKEIKTTLETYIKENLVLFITGEIAIDKEWDSYVKELDNIGLVKYIKVTQSAYDRAK